MCFVVSFTNYYIQLLEYSQVFTHIIIILYTRIYVSLKFNIMKYIDSFSFDQLVLVRLYLEKED